MKNQTLFSIFLLFALLFFKNDILRGQFGAGVAFSNDFYQRYTNPEDNLDLGRSSGSAILNFAIGPKLWIGKPAFSFSVEAQAGISLLGLDVSKFKGLGMSHFPIVGLFNFNGSSALGSEQKKGFSFGGGIQYNRTELYGVTSKYKDQGLTRSFFPTYVLQAGGGFGFNGFVVMGFLRYGFHPDSEARSFNIGIQSDLNILAFRKNLKNPNSSL